MNPVAFVLGSLGLATLAGCTMPVRTQPHGLEAELFPFRELPQSRVWSEEFVDLRIPLRYRPTLISSEQCAEGLVKLTLRNPGDAVLTYSGYDEDYPQMLQEVWEIDQWERGLYQGCGTGMEDYDWQPGEQRTFLVFLGPSKSLQRISARFREKGTNRAEALILLQQIPTEPLENIPVVLSSEPSVFGQVGVTIQNQGKTTLGYTGFSPGRPQMEQELWSPESGWQEGTLEGVCGNALDSYVLAPGETITLHGSFRPASSLQRLSVSFYELNSNRCESVALVNQIPFEAIP